MHVYLRVKEYIDNLRAKEYMYDLRVTEYMYELRVKKTQQKTFAVFHNDNLLYCLSFCIIDDVKVLLFCVSPNSDVILLWECEILT